MARTLGVGLIGCGNISDDLPAPTCRASRASRCAPAPTCGRSARAAQGAKFGVEALPVDALLARDDIDIVVNLTMPDAHVEVSLAALSRRQARLLREAAGGRRRRSAARSWPRRTSAGCCVGCAPDTFLGAGGRLARRLIDDGAIGKIARRHRLPDVARHGALAPGPGVLLQAGRRAGARHGALLHHRAGQPARPGRARVAAVDRHRLPGAHRHGRRRRRRAAASRSRRRPPCMALLRVRRRRAGDLRRELGRLEARPPADRALRREGSMRVPDPNFFGGVVEVTERGRRLAVATMRAACRSAPQLAGRRARASPTTGRSASPRWPPRLRTEGQAAGQRRLWRCTCWR